MSQRNATERRDPWLLIERRHLAALSAVAREGTFGGAALSLGYAQSAVSGQLAMLERIVGAQLIDRSPGRGGRRLTTAGEALLAHAFEIVAELEVAQDTLSSYDDEHDASSLRIGMAGALPSGFAERVLATAVAGASGLQPTEIVTVGSDEVVGGLRDEELDVTLISEPLEDPDVGTAQIVHEPPVLAVAAGSRLIHGRSLVSLEELRRLPLVAWREGAQPSRVELELAALGVEANVVAWADGSDTVVSLVGTGLGAAVLPRAALTARQELTTVALEAGLPARYVGVAWLRTRSGEPHVRAFIDRACQLRADSDLS